MKLLLGAVTALLFVACGDAHAAGSVEAGAARAAVCAGCHGPEGISVNPLWPNLAGQHAAYLRKQMRAFRDGQRVDPSMRPFVVGLSDADIADIAAFYASRRMRR